MFERKLRSEMQKSNSHFHDVDHDQEHGQEHEEHLLHHCEATPAASGPQVDVPEFP